MSPVELRLLPAQVGQHHPASPWRHGHSGERPEWNRCITRQSHHPHCTHPGTCHHIPPESRSSHSPGSVSGNVTSVFPTGRIYKATLAICHHCSSCWRIFFLPSLPPPKTPPRRNTQSHNSQKRRKKENRHLHTLAVTHRCPGRRRWLCTTAARSQEAPVGSISSLPHECADVSHKDQEERNNLRYKDGPLTGTPGACTMPAPKVHAQQPCGV